MFVVPFARSTAVTTAPALSQVVDRLFDETFDRFLDSTRALGAQTRTPTLDVSETDDAYRLAFDLPGVAKEDIRVTVEGRRVSVSTRKESQREVPTARAAESAEPATTTAVAETPVGKVPAERVLYRERSTVAYERTVVLPAEVDSQAGQAKFDNGVLTLTLPKLAQARPARLTIA